MKSKIILMFVMIIIVFIACKKDNAGGPVPDPSVHASDLSLYLKDATSNDTRLLNYHQNVVNNNHDSCFIYEQHFHVSDSLFSDHFYKYCHTIYTNTYVEEGNHHMGDNGEWNHESEKCSIDNIHYDDYIMMHNFSEHDSLLYHEMQIKNLSDQISQGVKNNYESMHDLRTNHVPHHAFHF